MKRRRGRSSRSLITVLASRRNFNERVEYIIIIVLQKYPFIFAANVLDRKSGEYKSGPLKYKLAVLRVAQVVYMYAHVA